MYPDVSVVSGVEKETTNRRGDQDDALHLRERLHVLVGSEYASDSKAEMGKTLERVQAVP